MMASQRESFRPESSTTAAQVSSGLRTAGEGVRGIQSVQLAGALFASTEGTQAVDGMGQLFLSPG